MFTSHEFSINQIVKLKYGTFKVLGFRSIENEVYAQVKEYDLLTNKTRGGELAFPVTSLTAI